MRYRQCVERMNDNYTRLFGTAPQQYKTPLEPNDHPELDLSPELDEDGIQKKPMMQFWNLRMGVEKESFCCFVCRSVAIFGWSVLRAWHLGLCG